MIKSTKYTSVPEVEKLDVKRVLELANSLDVSNIDQLLHFGASAQKNLTQISNHILQDISQDEAGRAGQLLSHMVGVLQGFQGKELQIKEKPSLIDRIFQRNTSSVGKFLQKLDSVSEELDQISNELELQKQKLLIDVKTLEKLYNAHLEHFYELDYHIAAGEEVVCRFRDQILPNLRSQSEYSQKIEDAQKLRDSEMQCAELERRLHDLRLTKQVAMQTLPSIRLIQENNKGLVNKINSTLVNTMPLWRQQLAQSIIILRSTEAAVALRESSDLTNNLLTANAESLQQATQESRKQIERGVFDLATVEKANQMLIETIEESIVIHENGRKQRSEAVNKLQAAENALRESLHKAAKNNGGDN